MIKIFRCVMPGVSTRQFILNRTIVLILLFPLQFIYTTCNFCAAQDPAQEDSLGKWVVFHKSNSRLPGNNITAITQDESGNIWVGISGKLMKFDGTEWSNLKKPGSWRSSGKITSIAIDRYHNPWVGNSSGGMANFEETGWSVINEKNSDLPGNSVSAIAIDEKGNKWIGTQDSGLVKYNDTLILIFEEQDTILPNKNINSIVIDRGGNIWMGTNNGLVQFDGDSTWTVYKGSSLGVNTINTIAIDKNKSKWLGCGSANSKSNGGVVLFSAQSGFTTEGKGKLLAHYSAFNSQLPSNYISSVTIDNKGEIWIAARNCQYADFKSGTTTFVKGGIAKYDSSGWINLTPSFSQFLKTTPVLLVNLPGLETKDQAINSCHNINVIFVDMNGNKWLGTDNGLFVYNEKGVILK
ncbi:MAG: two-component regulator propeller domain-containing protein [Bacteroidota bacterium]